MNDYNSMGNGGKASSDNFMEKGKTEKPKAKYKETCNPDESVPKLPQIDGAEQG